MTSKIEIRLTTLRPAEDVTRGVDAILTDEHSQSSYGIPVVVIDGVAYGAADLSTLADEYEVHILGAANNAPAFTPAYKAIVDAAHRGGYTLSDSSEAWADTLTR